MVSMIAWLISCSVFGTIPSSPSGKARYAAHATSTGQNMSRSPARINVGAVREARSSIVYPSGVVVLSKN